MWPPVRIVAARGQQGVIASVRGNSLRVAPHLSEPALRAAPGQERNHSLSPALADASAHIAAVS